ncbi:MAG: ParA family protein [Rhodocyclaceae bacterium]|nr:ParA family protein [Rhodocyclaceae bacterium]
MNIMRDTFADISALTYRLRAASALLRVTDNTIRGYADHSGIPVRRASDVTPGAPPVRIFEPATLFSIAQWRRQQGYVRGVSRRAVIAVDVIKGGTGKTTTAVELAVHLQFMGLRCLLIDLDIQANATQLMGYEPDLTLDEASQYGVSEKAIVSKTISHALIPYIESRTRGTARATWDLSDVIKTPFGPHGPHLVPADTFLGDIEQAIANAKGQRELYLGQMLQDAMAGKIDGFDLSGYDVIIFDCPPSVSYTSTSAIAAADYVVAPIRLDAFSVKGLVKLMREIEAVTEAYRSGRAPDLVILPTHHVPQFSRIGRMQAQLQQHYSRWLAPCVISSSEEFPKASEAYLPLALMRPTSQQTAEYRAFAEFIHGKLVS